MSSNYDVIKPSSVSITEHTVLKTFVYTLLIQSENDLFNFETQDLRWKLEICPNYLMHLTLVSGKNGDSLSIDVRYFLAPNRIKVIYGFEKVSQEFRYDELKNLPVRKSINFCGANYVHIELIVLKDKVERSKTILNDFYSLLKTEKLTDLIIQVEDKEFKAHKSILMAHSPVFSAMFDNDMIEKKENRIRIEDVDSQVFHEFLKFIYSGSVTDLDVDAAKLLPIAEKYQMDDLKHMCSTAMINNINVKNVAGTLISASLYGDDKLREQSLKFIGENLKDVVKTEEFEIMITSHPHLSFEIFKNIAQNS